MEEWRTKTRQLSSKVTERFKKGEKQLDNGMLLPDMTTAKATGWS